jgi:hypothetical protein
VLKGVGDDGRGDVDGDGPEDAAAGGARPRHPALALLGRWRLTRRIEDRRADQAGAFDGEAVLRQGSDALIWEEEGRLRLGPAETIARRSYLWRLRAPDVADIRHHDGRAFHAIALPDFAGGRVAARHDCAPDLYEGLYVFDSADRWRLTWRVRGPRKDYCMTTEHLRLAP